MTDTAAEPSIADAYRQLAPHLAAALAHPVVRELIENRTISGHLPDPTAPEWDDETGLVTIRRWVGRCHRALSGHQLHHRWPAVAYLSEAARDLAMWETSIRRPDRADLRDDWNKYLHLHLERYLRENA